MLSSPTFQLHRPVRYLMKDMAIYLQIIYKRKQERKRSELTAQNRQKERNKKEHFKNKKNGTRKNTLRTKRTEQERAL